MKRIISIATLRKFWDAHPDSEMALKSWYDYVKEFDWDQPADVKNSFRNASILKGGRIVFNIKGNQYRLVTDINYQKKWVYIRFIGTHKEYDRIDANEI